MSMRHTDKTLRVGRKPLAEGDTTLSARAFPRRSKAVVVEKWRSVAGPAKRPNAAPAEEARPAEGASARRPEARLEARH